MSAAKETASTPSTAKQRQTRSAAEVRAAAMAHAALEGSTTSMMMCDDNRIITYVNPANQEMLAKYTGQLQRYLDDPTFDPRNLVGRCIDDFHRRPAHQEGVLNRTARGHHANVSLGDMHLLLKLSTLRDAEGAHLGWAVEWVDQSARTEFSKEVERVTNELQAGDTEARCDLERADADYRDTMERINQIIDVLMRPLNEIAQFVSAVAQGARPGPVLEGMGGDFGKLRHNFDSLAASMDEVAGTARRIADGDLSVTVQERSPDDELMGALSAMVNDLNGFMGNVREAVGEMGVGADQMQSATQRVADNVQSSAGSLQEISSTMVELSAQTRHNADNARQALQLATAAREDADTGDGRMASMLEAMREINDSSQRISNIIKVIDEIAFQTNLLALNAAVEAARAGAHGKGFAVVAEEVRNLAARSAKAAKETSAMISDSMKKVEQGTSIARNTAQVFHEILAGITKVADLSGEIAAASGEQASGFDQMSQGLHKLDDVVQQNAAAAQQMAASATELRAQGRRVAELGDRYTLREVQTIPAGMDMTGMPPELMAAFQAFLAQQRGGGVEVAQPALVSDPFAAGGYVNHSGPGAPSATGRFARPGGLPSDVISLDDADFGRY
ncbi:MAG: hypothetical protein CSA66_03785 [Proteobacteria bacterium]|nr:MAG: hypothetical protein CSA66_03785 [Pseudomonadota bacterium]